MFHHRNQLRRWAARVLLLWLFGIGTGVANACLGPSLADSGAHPTGHSSASQATHGDTAVLPSAVHERPQADDLRRPPPEGPFGKSNCQDFCEKSTVSIPPLKSALDNVHALLPGAVMVILPVPAFSPDELLLPRRDGGLAPVPIRTAFLRLALSRLTQAGRRAPALPRRAEPMSTRAACSASNLTRSPQVAPRRQTSLRTTH